MQLLIHRIKTRLMPYVRNVSTHDGLRCISSIEEVKKNTVKFALTADPMVDAFAFMHQDTLYAYVNKCPHAQLELDLEDADFFRNGFIHCKVHGALFQIESGQCIKPPLKCRALKPLKSIFIEQKGNHVYIDETRPAVNVPSRQKLKINTGDDERVDKQKDLDRLEEQRALFVESLRAKHKKK